MQNNWKLINFYHEHPDLIKEYEIVDTEVEGMAVEVVGEDGFEYVSPAHSFDAEPEFWSVYVRQKQEEDKYNVKPFNPRICIADFNDEDDAKEFEKFIRILLKLPTND